MNEAFPPAMRKLIKEFSRMPGIGVRSAERLTFYILRAEAHDIKTFLTAVKEVKENVRACVVCNNLAENERCDICDDPARDNSKLCVVEGPNGVIAMERSGVYKGLYHVLLGQLSPLDGVGPDELKINDLIKRVEKDDLKEIIVATDFTTEGEMTALYLQKIMGPFDVTVTRLARGVPAGAMLEYADVATLQRAFEERRGA